MSFKTTQLIKFFQQYRVMCDSKQWSIIGPLGRAENISKIDIHICDDCLGKIRSHWFTNMRNTYLYRVVSFEVWLWSWSKRPSERVTCMYEEWKQFFLKYLEIVRIKTKLNGVALNFVPQKIVI